MVGSSVEGPLNEDAFCPKCLPQEESVGFSLSDSDCYQHRTPMELLLDPSICVKVCAPMVRYSKLPFRQLVRRYGCDVAFTPMIVADPFVRSEKAREAEFSTCSDDRPLIVQFGAANAVEFSEATKMVANVCDGVDLNCGCPQRWVSKKGFGACLINKPEIVSDMVKHVRRLPLQNSLDFSVSIKIRVHTDIRKTVELCQAAEKAGVSFITVHGRTAAQRREPITVDGIRTIKDSVGVPVIANGGMKTLSDVHRVHSACGVDGVMVAEGLLDNPAMFLPNCLETPEEVVNDYVRLAMTHGSRYQSFHHHLIFMLQRKHSKPEKKIFNALNNANLVLDYLKKNHDWFRVDSDLPHCFEEKDGDMSLVE